MGECSKSFPSNRIPFSRLSASLDVNGGWNTWTAWGSCSATCGDGTQSQSRACDNPAPVGGGTPCSGPSTQSQACNLGDCPCPPDDNGLSASDYVQVGQYYFHEAAKGTWDTTEGRCTALKLQWANVDTPEMTQALISSGLGECRKKLLQVLFLPLLPPLMLLLLLLLQLLLLNFLLLL